MREYKFEQEFIKKLWQVEPNISKLVSDKLELLLLHFEVNNIRQSWIVYAKCLIK